MMVFCVCACSADESGMKLGMTLTEDPSTTDLGLSTYPGSKPYKENDDSSAGADVRMATPWFGLKVAAIKLETPDKLESVAAFYRHELSKYGSVLECSDSPSKTSSGPVSDSDLSCDGDPSGQHTLIYKVGTRKNQRIVALQPHNSGTRFSLVHVDVRGEAKQ